jgi:hypothetical protein
MDKRRTGDGGCKGAVAGPDMDLLLAGHGPTAPESNAIRYLDAARVLSRWQRSWGYEARVFTEDDSDGDDSGLHANSDDVVELALAAKEWYSIPGDRLPESWSDGRVTGRAWGISKRDWVNRRLIYRTSSRIAEAVRHRWPDPSYVFPVSARPGPYGFVC